MLDHDTGLIKIGKSHNPDQRLIELTREPTLGPKPLQYELIDAFLMDHATEKELHELFADCRKRGEWFDLDDDGLDSIIYEVGDAERWSGQPSFRTVERMQEADYYRQIISEIQGLYRPGEVEWLDDIMLAHGLAE